MRKFTLLLIVLFYSILTFAQADYIHQVIFLNEGSYDYIADTQVVDVTIGSYDPVTKAYSNFDTIYEMRWGSDVVVDDNIYVAGDTFLTHQRINSAAIPGIRKLAIWNNYILVSRGWQYSDFNAYFQVYDKSTLNLVYELDTLNGPKYSSEGMAIYNDTLYIAVSNSFKFGSYVGFVGLIDLSNQNYTTEVDLGPQGMNPDNIMVDGSNIYTLNNKDWSGSSVTSYDATNRSFMTVDVAMNSGCGTSVFAANHVYYQEYAVNKLARFNVNTQTIVDTLANATAYYGLVTDTVNSILYGAATDYFSFGMAYIMQFDGTLIDSFSVGVSPGTIALDVRKTSGINDLSELQDIIIYPNPASNNIMLSLDKFGTYLISLSDVLGNVIYRKNLSNIDNYKMDISSRYSCHIPENRH